MVWMPWQVAAFIVVLISTSVWVWLPDSWHAAVRASRVGRILPAVYAIVLAAVFASLFMGALPELLPT